jgi:hypothetical protein
MKSLAICAMIRDEAAYLPEWLAFHSLVGVDKWFIYDDDSADDTSSVLQKAASRFNIELAPPVEKWDTPECDGLVTANGWHKSVQCRAFTHFSRHHAGDYWCAFIDPDEFLFSTNTDDLRPSLDGFPYPAVVANWLVFGANGHQTKPAGLTIESYTRRGEPGQPEPWGRHVKPIVNMSAGPVWGPNGSHCPVFDGGMVAVDQNGKDNPYSVRPVEMCDDIGLRVNHYYHRSYEEARAKLTREYHNFPGYPGNERLPPTIETKSPIPRFCDSFQPSRIC